MRISKFLYPPSIARCQHVKVNGVQCGSPSLKSRKLCHFHQRWQQGRIQLNANQARRSRYSLDLPILEDANSIQVALMQGMRLLLTNQVDHRTAALLFYALQTASSNLSRTTFEPRPQQVVIDPSSIADTSLGDDAWYKEEFELEEAETDKDDEAGDDLPATVNIQAMADSDRVEPGLQPGVCGRNPKAAVTATELPLRSWTDFTAPALAGGWAKAATSAHALPESFPLFRSHVLPALGHAAAEIRTMETVASKSAEEDSAQRQNSNRLPEGNLTPAKERRQQPIPQLQHYFAADGDKCQHPQNRQRSNENHFLHSRSHVQALIFVNSS